jgi:integrase
VWSWEQMHEFAAASGDEAMVRVLSDCGLRLGEMLALERRHWSGDALEVRQTAWEGRVLQGTKIDHGEADAGRVAPVPPAACRVAAGAAAAAGLAAAVPVRG